MEIALFMLAWLILATAGGLALGRHLRRERIAHELQLYLEEERRRRE